MASPQSFDSLQILEADDRANCAQYTVAEVVRANPDSYGRFHRVELRLSITVLVRTLESTELQVTLSSPVVFTE